MVKYYCEKCNYRFQTSLSELPRLCPYCGERGSINREESAEEMVE